MFKNLKKLRPLFLGAAAIFVLSFNPGLSLTTQAATLTISNVQVSTTYTTATITWTTNLPADSEVGYLWFLSKTNMVQSELTTSHSITLTSLLSGANYNYTIKSISQDGQTAFQDYKPFTTKVQPGSSLTTSEPVSETDPAGTNIISSGTVYLITASGQKRPYTSAGAFLSYGFNAWTNVVQAGSADLALPTGNFIPPRDGKIICSNKGSDTGTCYLITDSKKAAFTSAAVFTGLGFSFSDSLSGDVSFLPPAPNINSVSQAHPAGVLINKGGTIYLVGDNGLLGIPNMGTLTSWGYSLTDSVPANAADSAMAQAGVMSARTAGALSPFGN